LERKYVLNKKHINYHVFNQSEADDITTENEAVSVDLEIDPVREGRVFPISVLFR
jgi:hypothetical protein